MRTAIITTILASIVFGLTGCDGDPSRASGPPCATNLQIIDRIRQSEPLPDTVIIGQKGYALDVSVHASPFTCDDGRVEYISRNPGVVNVARVGSAAVITSMLPGTTVLVAHMTADDRA